MEFLRLGRLVGAGLVAGVLLLSPSAGRTQILYFIQADHLNTPRLISDSTGAAVWRWDNQEPFGNDVPNENPSGLGTLVVPLRFPGQYFDRETSLAYNVMRDYDPGIGRYMQSDPIGLQGGLNTYGYVGGNPLSFTDSSGLEIVCTYVTGDIYKRTERVKVREEQGYWARKCHPVPKIGPPLPPHDPPRRRGGRRLPFPWELHWEMECKYDWVVTQPEVWEQRITYWMPQWYDCVDTCTGNTFKVGLPDQQVNK